MDYTMVPSAAIRINATSGYAGLLSRKEASGVLIAISSYEYRNHDFTLRICESDLGISSTPPIDHRPREADSRICIASRCDVTIRGTRHIRFYHIPISYSTTIISYSTTIYFSFSNTAIIINIIIIIIINMDRLLYNIIQYGLDSST